LVDEVCEDTLIYIGKIIFEYKDYYGGISSAYIISFGKYPDVSSVSLQHKPKERQGATSLFSESTLNYWPITTQHKLMVKNVSHVQDIKFQANPPNGSREGPPFK
jgi:hypothetical protein